MFLKKIEIQGFKSFGNKTELKFNKNLTSIVGPNGSGKSNIADAIRWVTGEQSQKLLRTKKSEEVIFAGSDKKAKLGMAEVNLFLDNSDKKIPLDFDEVVITRRVYRTGESEYIINKNKVRLSDIQLLLAKANFGQGNYSIVGQGMIDGILNQSSVSRKDFFDEATGDLYYTGSVDYNFLTEWILHTPLLITLEGIDIETNVSEELEPIIPGKSKSFETIK